MVFSIIKPSSGKSITNPKHQKRKVMTAPNSFPLFASLPPELRLKIYREIENLNLSVSPLGLTSRVIDNLHILKISYSPSLNRYISNTPPPITLSISRESREQTLFSWSYLSLGPAPGKARPKLNQVTSRSSSYTNASSPYQHHYASSSSSQGPTSSTEQSTKGDATKSVLPLLAIPVDFSRTILYISNLSLLLSTLHFQHTFLFHLSTSQSRHLIEHLAIDLRVWNDLCENGFLGVLARMKGLRELSLVVEFGRSFTGPLGFLEAPTWRTDLHYLARNATREIERIRGGIRGAKQGFSKDGVARIDAEGEQMRTVDVRCVILTRGGEQA